MPTILRFAGLWVVIYPNDHSPPHVHVIGAAAEAVFELHCPQGPVTLRESGGFLKGQLRSVMEDLDTRLELLCSEWERIHGTDRC